ncbi:acyl-CoA N-acyltransferase [Nadsonia fulvescens var. elongata DSM 6958]|uniref:Glucosamine 6-phosphate N-acetyltransferase n=1 Tax=Nadsonia fulvescens var. elongata DSM 6958 TaxID=857566 RepID=A0A1E3PIV3_9ASCO|nr:acyl-CoA N-acyltransferase [Nadsonia fulvescens var. elongata DSM 6958]
MTSEQYLFDPSLIPASFQESLPAGYHIRPLSVLDYNRGVLEVLAVLTTVGPISKEEFATQFQYWKKQNDTYYVIVITDAKNQVMAIGSVIIERKLIHQCGLAGHIEDIAVASDQQGKKLGLHLINTLTNIAKTAGAYKVILDCSIENVGFYEKCGYKNVGAQMKLAF